MLVLNLLLKENLQTSFRKRMNAVFESIQVLYNMLQIENMKQFEDDDNKMKYTHLLISGSEASVTKDYAWYPSLVQIIDWFRTQKLPILGICFGHQFLIRHILGKKFVRRSPTPEIGWSEIKLVSNSIFHGMNKLKTAVFHYDEVYNVDQTTLKKIDIIASSERCEIQGFQLKGTPIWGIQFHPDFIFEDTFDFVKADKNKKENLNEYFVNCNISASDYQVNDKIFNNWIGVKQF